MATVYEFNYTGSEQSVTLPLGKYKLECWGASGGSKAGSPLSQASGGYTCGEFILRKQTPFYVYVGQSGYEIVNSEDVLSSLSYNGGGRANSIIVGSSKYSFRGGGATDIRLVGGAWDDSQGLLSRIIVAGGGGSFRVSSVSSFGKGGGFVGGMGVGGGYACTGGSQYEGGIAYGSSLSSSFGKGGSGAGVAGGGGWYGGAGSIYDGVGGGGSGYALTKDSYKPKGYTPTFEYFLENIQSIMGGNTTKLDGYAKITLLQALPFLSILSYNSTQVTFKADHTDPALLTKIECFIDDILKETITTDLTTEKTINYTLADNALHTLKIVVTDSSNTTAEKVLSVSKNIMPLGDDASIRDIVSKMSEIKEGLVNGKTSIINVLALKNIESSLKTPLVELSEKIKKSFDSSDASVYELQNRITELTNQLSQRKRFARGTYDPRINSEITTIPMNLSFTPSIIIVNCGISFYYENLSSANSYIKFVTNLSESQSYKTYTKSYDGYIMANITDVSSNSFILKLTKLSGSYYEYRTLSGTSFTWLAIE